MLKPRDLANLLNRAAAALETPGDLTVQDKLDLIEDLVTEAKAVDPDQPPLTWCDPLCSHCPHEE